MNAHPALPALDTYAEGQLSEARRQEIEVHLSTCATCRAAVARQAQMAALLRRLPAEAPGPSLTQRVLATLDAARARRSRALRRTLAAATVCAVLGLALMAGSWAEAVSVTDSAAGAWQSVGATLSLGDLVTAPDEAIAAWVNALLDWQGLLTESAGAALMIGVSLLSAAALSALATLLGPAAPANGHSL